MESVRGKYKPQAPCPCGAVDEKGKVIKHQRPTHKMCLRNPKRMRTGEPVTEDPTERFTIKVNIDSMFNCDTDFGQRFKDCMLEAIDRYNHITFLASKLITLHVIRLSQEQIKHYKDERPTRWKTYCREQKALHDICMRIKGKKRAKKEDVVVAYGDGLFGSTMRGKRAAPVKKLRKHLRRYVTVVPVDEFRTSRVCSTHNGVNRERTGLGEEEDEGGGSTTGPGPYPRTA